jgi:methanogenic corrinoid protein MtbC1
MTSAATVAPITDDDRHAYLEILDRADETGASAFVLGLLDRGTPAEEVLLGLIAPSQATVGDRWARSEWSVAQEHAATHVSEQAVTAVSAWSAAHRPATGCRGTVVVACVDGEWHALPAKLFAEVIRLHGWNVRFLGASVPGPHLISYLHQHGPDVLAVSCSLPTRLTTAQRIIEAAQEAGVPVLAGGAGFGPEARWGRRLGADRVAADAAGAVAILDTWPGRAPVTLGDIAEKYLVDSYVVDDEHLLVAKRRTDLVVSAMEDLENEYPQVRSYTSYQYEATRTDLEYIVDFLAAALFVDDPLLFTTFVGWMRVVLSSRRVPMDTVAHVFATYRRELYDFPRAIAYLTAGTRALSA